MLKPASEVDFSDVRIPWTNVYGLARTILALGTLITLVANSTETLFGPLPGGLMPSPESGRWLKRFSLFSLFGPHHLGLARVMAIAVLTVVASGWRPKLTGLLHWWVSYSFLASSIAIDGGDQITAILTFLLIPVATSDPRGSHWDDPPELGGLPRALAALIDNSFLFMCRVQVAVIYFHAAIGKFAVEEWANGTVLYYWMLDPVFGVPNAMRPVVSALIGIPFVVVVMTYSVLLLEVLLSAGLVMAKAHRAKLFWAGLLFHAAIAVAHGLLSFFFAMAGALVLYLLPVHRPIDLTWETASKVVSGSLDWLRRRTRVASVRSS